MTKTSELNRRQNLLLMLLFTLVAYAVFYVWPTMYKYDHLGAIPVRWNRVTSEAEYLSLNGWQPQIPIENRPATFRPPRPTPVIR